MHFRRSLCALGTWFKSKCFKGRLFLSRLSVWLWFWDFLWCFRGEIQELGSKVCQGYSSVWIEHHGGHRLVLYQLLNFDSHVGYKKFERFIQLNIHQAIGRYDKDLLAQCDVRLLCGCTGSERLNRYPRLWVRGKCFSRQLGQPLIVVDRSWGMWVHRAKVAVVLYAQSASIL